MGREIRRVPVDFVHPKDEYGHDQGMFDRTVDEAQAEWEKDKEKFFTNGKAEEVWTQEDIDRMLSTCEDYHHAEILKLKVGDKKWPDPSEYIGSPPTDHPDWYRPEWPADAVLGYVVYQTVSEGSPVTPCFATQDELWFHLVNHGTDYDPPMSREGAQAFIGSGWAPSFVGSARGIESGLAALDPGGPLSTPRRKTQSEILLEEMGYEKVGETTIEGVIQDAGNS